jgi:glycerophosphoryl diester phosphodiesterase
MRAALEHGAAGLEFDLHLSRDGQLVVHHDAVLAVGDARLTIAETDLADLRAIDPDLAILGDVLEAFPSAPLNVEIKAREAAEPAARRLAVESPPRPVIVTAVDPKSIAIVRRFAPGLDTAPGWTTDFAFWALSRVGIAAPNKRDVAVQIALRFDQVEYLKRIPLVKRLRIVDRRLVTAAHRRGLAVHVWTLNTPEEFDEAIDAGADGIFTDVPTALTAHLKSRGVYWHEGPD